MEQEDFPNRHRLLFFCSVLMMGRGRLKGSFMQGGSFTKVDSRRNVRVEPIERLGWWGELPLIGFGLQCQ